MKKLVLAANDAPLSGKTSFVNVLSEDYARKGISSIALFTDAQTAPTDHVFWDLEAELEPERLLQCLEEADVVAVDISTGHAGVITDFFNDRGMFDLLVDLDVELCIAITCLETEAAFQGVVTLADGFADNAEYLLLRAAHLPEGESEADWSGSYAEKVMNYVGATAVDVPEFDADMLAELEDHGKCLAGSLASRKELPRFLRDAVHSWELEYADAISVAEEMLTPDTSGSSSVYGNSVLGR